MDNTNASKRYAAAVDIGGTSTRVALFDEDYNLISRNQFATLSEDPAENCRLIAEQINAFDVPVVGVGISCPGILDTENGWMNLASNFGDAWIHFPLAKTITDHTGAPAWIANDANLAALAEAVVGEGKDKKIVQFLTISTGIGGGMIVNKEIFEGAHGSCNEISNIVLNKDGDVQGGLLPGAVEAIASGTAITRKAKEAGLDVAHAGEVNDLAVAGNETAAKIMDEAKEALARMLSILIAVSDPDIFILGGSVAMKIDGYVEDVQERTRALVYPVLQPTVDVRRSTLNEDSGLIGAAALAFTKTERAE